METLEKLPKQEPPNETKVGDQWKLTTQPTLEDEKKAIEARILANQKVIESAETAIHWDKKKLKIVNQQIAAQAETPLQTLEKITKL